MFQPPTDNLYRLMVIFGLVVMVASAYFTLQQLQELNRAQFQRRLSDAEVRWRWKVVLDQLDRQVECSRDALSLPESGEKRAARRKYCAEFKAASEQMRAEVEQRLSELAQSGVHQNWARLMEANYKRWRLAGVIGGVFGFSLSVAGFILWYVRLQRYEDAAARTKMPAAT